jgi:hypothetical protein
MKQVFTDATLHEANREADKWWAQQKGMRLVRRSQVDSGWRTPTTGQDRHWDVTIYYEPEEAQFEPSAGAQPHR